MLVIGLTRPTRDILSLTRYTVCNQSNSGSSENEYAGGVQFDVDLGHASRNGISR